MTSCLPSSRAESSASGGQVGEFRHSPLVMPEFRASHWAAVKPELLSENSKPQPCRRTYSGHTGDDRRRGVGDGNLHEAVVVVVGCVDRLPVRWLSALVAAVVSERSLTRL